MAQDDFVATGNPAWLLIKEDEADVVAASLAVESVRHGPATVASVVLSYDADYEAGTELTLSDVLAAIKALEGIARQAILDGYGTPQQLVPNDMGGTSWLREDSLPTADPFDSFEIEECGEVANPDDPGTTIVERINDSAEWDGEYDRTFWTVYGRRDNEGVTALWDAPTEMEAREMAAILATTQPVYLVIDGSWTMLNDPGSES